MPCIIQGFNINFNNFNILYHFDLLFGHRSQRPLKRRLNWFVMGHNGDRRDGQNFHVPAAQRLLRPQPLVMDMPYQLRGHVYTVFSHLNDLLHTMCWQPFSACLSLLPLCLFCRDFTGHFLDWARHKGEHESGKPTDPCFWMAQVFTDLGSTSVEAGTCHRYPPYLSLNLVLKFLIRVRDI